MSGPNDGGPAYPHEADYIRGDKPGDPFQFKVDFHPGMTLRDYFAGQALAGLLRDVTDADQRKSILANTKPIAEICGELASAMIAERERGGAK